MIVGQLGSGESISVHRTGSVPFIEETVYYGLRMMVVLKSSKPTPEHVLVLMAQNQLLLEFRQGVKQ